MKHNGKPFVLIVILSLMFVGSPALAAQETDNAIDDIVADVSDTRGLEPRGSIDVMPMTREQLARELEQDLIAEYPEEEQNADERELIAFGLMDPDVDLGDLNLELLTEQVAGYYDPETGELVVIGDAVDGSEFTPSQQVTYAHEIVHALQDQHFDLDSGALDRETFTDDQALAVTALIEGDASFSEVQYLLERPALLENFLTEIENREFDSDVLESAPPILSATLLFPYEHGFTFVEAIHRDGGWETVNAAFSNPPQSTEQILHPEKYLAGEAPVAISVPDFTSSLGSEWQVFDTNTMGEFQIRTILQQTSMPDDKAETAAAGWGGDTYIVAGTDTQDAIRWTSAWDSNEDAAQFAQALALYESERWNIDPNYVSDTVIRFNGEGVAAQITLEGDTVTYLQAPDQETLEIIAGAGTTGGTGTPAATPAGTPVATPAT